MTFAPSDLEIWQMTLKNSRAPLLCYYKLCAWFHCHMWIQTVVTVRKLQTSKFGSKSAIFVPCDLEIWQMILENIRAPHLSYFKLCAWLHCHMWIQTGVTVRKRVSWVLTSVTLTFDLRFDLLHGHHFCPWSWWCDGGNSEKGVTVGQADRRTDWTSHRAAWS